MNVHSYIHMCIIYEYEQTHINMHAFIQIFVSVSIYHHNFTSISPIPSPCYRGHFNFSLSMFVTFLSDNKKPSSHQYVYYQIRVLCMSSLFHCQSHPSSPRQHNQPPPITQVLVLPRMYTLLFLLRLRHPSLGRHHSHPPCGGPPCLALPKGFWTELFGKEETQ